MSSRVSIAIIDYGMGNLRSVANAVAVLGHEPRVTRDPDELRAAAGVVLPGVGAFGDGMTNLRSGGWIEALERVRADERPFMGLCLGMQLLAETGTEHGRHTGLGWVKGEARRIEPDDPALRVPHIGWNDVRVIRKDGLYAGIDGSPTFYFVHSYVLCPDDPGVVTGVCSYGSEFAASLELGNVWATQYHPEKSQKAGLAVLANFLARCR
jgi:glutamine amidotransferase